VTLLSHATEPTARGIGRGLVLLVVGVASLTACGSGGPVSPTPAQVVPTATVPSEAVATSATPTGDTPTERSTSTDELPEPGQAVLDFDDASITLPLDAYGMSLRERQVGRAAQAVVYWRCLTGAAELSAEARQNALAFLSWNPYHEYWAFGFWDADYIAVNGPGAPPGPALGPTDADPEQARTCVSQADYQDLTVVDGMTWTGEGTGPAANLIGYRASTGDSATADPRVLALLSLRADCVRQKGYQIETGDSLQSVAIDPAATDEQRAQAMIAEAECDADLHTTQQAADILAGYQQVLIDQHQSELLAIKNIADQRSAEASRILAEAGIG
jgi:predicted small lipoprotein YifL